MTQVHAGGAVALGTTAPLYQEMLVTAEAVQERIENMAAEVVCRYRGENPLFVCLLRGGAPFATQLMNSVARLDPTFHPEMDYMTVSTYKDGQAAGKPKIVMGLSPKTEVNGRTAVMLDDLIDTGKTTAFVDKHLRARRAAEVESIVLVQRRRLGAAQHLATMFGFEVSDERWLTGMGMDDARIGREANRWAGFIAVATDA